LLAELSKIHSALTVAQTLHPLPSNIQSAPQLGSTSNTKAASPPILDSCCTEGSVGINTSSKNFVQVKESMDISRARREGESSATSDPAKCRPSYHSPFLEVQAGPGQEVPSAVTSQDSAAGFSIGATALDRLPADNSVVRAVGDVAKKSTAAAEQGNQSVCVCALPVQSDMMVTGTVVVLNSVMEQTAMVARGS
jgi:hypothetical protein